MNAPDSDQAGIWHVRRHFSVWKVIVAFLGGLTTSWLLHFSGTEALDALGVLVAVAPVTFGLGFWDQRVRWHLLYSLAASIACAATVPKGPEADLFLGSSWCALYGLIFLAPQMWLGGMTASIAGIMLSRMYYRIEPVR